MRNVGRERDDRESTDERRRRREYDDEVYMRRRTDGRSKKEFGDDRRHDGRRQDEERRSLDSFDEKRRDRFDHEDDRHRDTKHKSNHRRHSRSPSPPAPSPAVIPAQPSLSLPPPAPALAPHSKMDRYFRREYDPRLDLGEVPKEGFIGEVGWDNMLAILKERGKKRRHHSPTLSDDPLDIPVATAVRASSPRRIAKSRLDEKRRKRRGGSDESEDGRERVKRKEKRRVEKEREKALTTPERGAGDGKSMFDMAYVKKGSVREWDVGK